MDSTTQIDFVQEGRILRIQKDAPKVLDNTIKKQFSRHLEWISEGDGWHPFKKRSALLTLCIGGGAAAATLSPKTPHSCPQHCPPKSPQTSPSSSQSNSPTVSHKSSFDMSSMTPSGTTLLFVAVGALGGTFLWTRIAEGTQEFQDWEAEKTYDELFQFITTHYADHDDLEDFQCPLSTQLMYIPLKTPTGQFLDKGALKDIKKDALGRYISPWRGEPFYESDLQIGYECGIKIAKCVRSLMREDDKALNNSTSDSQNNPFPKIINIQNRFIDYLYRHAEGAFLPKGHNKTFEEQVAIRKGILDRCGQPQDDMKS